ncbi:MAG TPA: hypothetical protein VKB88_06490 [Bryobacteraceae bacterium]|nr:hypothetical protein [Bryobacteraceae bacterium]
MRRFLVLAAALAGIAAAADQQTSTGVITDTMCGKAHAMVSGQPDDKCIAMCVKGTSSQYALYDGKSVLELSDQKTPAKYAARRVKVTGTAPAIDTPRPSTVLLKWSMANRFRFQTGFEPFATIDAIPAEGRRWGSRSRPAMRE